MLSQQQSQQQKPPNRMPVFPQMTLSNTDDDLGKTFFEIKTNYFIDNMLNKKNFQVLIHSLKHKKA